METTTFFALDIGNKQTKLKSSKKKYVIPSSLVDQEDVMSIFSLDRKDNRIRDTFSANLNGDTKKYYLGQGIFNYSQDKIQDSIGYSGRYDQEIYSLLNEFALGILGKDFSSDELSSVCVAVGVPTGDYVDQKNNIINKIKSIFLNRQKDDTFSPKKHLISIDGKEMVIRVVEVLVFPQTMGAFYDEVLNDNLTLKDNNLLEERVGIVDLGGGTALFDQVIRNNLDPNARIQLQTGATVLYDSIANSIQQQLGVNPDIHKIEKMIKETLQRKNGVTEFIYKQSVNNIFDVTDLVLNKIHKYTITTANKVFSTFKSLDEIDVILVTGGTANIIDHDLFARVFRNKTKVKFVEDSEFANVNGFYKFTRFSVE